MPTPQEVRASIGFSTPEGCFIPAIVTPLNEKKELDVESLKKLVAYMFGAGSAGLYIGGNTGEGMVLDVATRKALAEVCVDEAKKVVKEGKPCITIIHCGHPMSSVAMELAAHAKSIGATSVSSMPPYVGCTKTFDVVKEFYTRFCAAAAPLPVVGYQIPTITGVNLNTAQMGELMEIDGFCGFKYTEGDLYKLECLMAKHPNTVMLQGLSTTQVGAVLYGASGGITGGGGNLMPATLCLLHKAMAAGDIAKAMEYQKAFNRVQETLYGPFAKKMVATFKHYLMKKGIIANSIMVEDPSLTEEEVASFEAACASCDFRPADEE